MEINDTLVDAHLPTVKSVGTLTARRLAYHQAQDFGWQTNWTSYFSGTLVLGILLEVSTYFLNGLDVSGGKSDADFGKRCLFSLLDLLKFVFRA